MYNGEYPYSGAAACSWDLPIGTWVYLSDGTALQCLDRGHLASTHIDVYVGSHWEGRELIAEHGDWTEIWIE